MSENAKRVKVFERLKETHEEGKCHGVKLKNDIQHLLKKIEKNKECDYFNMITELESLERKIERELQTFKDNYEAVEFEMENQDTEKNQWNILKKFREKRDAVRLDLDNCFVEIKNLENKYYQTFKKNEKKNQAYSEKIVEARADIDKMNTDLKQNIEIIISDQSEEQFIDKKVMNNELTQSLNEINNLLKRAEKNYTAVKNYIDAFEDLDELYQCVYDFKNERDELKSIISQFEAKIKNIFKRYTISPQAKLAISIRETSEQLGLKLEDLNGLNLFKMPLQETSQDKMNCLRRFELGDARLDKDHRYVIFMGMTGSGKSLLINNIINYIYGVSLTDKFRFKLIIESEEIGERVKGSSDSQAESMTSWVTSYTFHWQEGFRIPFSLTVIDTPGFGDTRGLEYDEMIIDQVRNFFKNKDIYPSQELTCLGLVMQASQARITEEQKYILDQVLNIFGKDMSNNIFIIFTFADAQPPPAIEVLKKNKIPFAPECTFKFNNSAVYAPNDDDISSYAWDFGYKSLKGYFDALAMKDPVSLVQTKQVLDERESLRIYLCALQNGIINGIETLQLIEDQSRAIVQLNGTLKANKNFKVKKRTFKCDMIVINHSITNCSQCNFTCHDPCHIDGDIKSRCSSMKEDCCVVCPSNCHYSKHTNGTSIYNYTPVVIEETIEEMMKHYNVALGEKNAKKKILQTMLATYEQQKNKVFESIQEANRCANRLEEIALRSSYLTNIQFIERLIESEKRSSRLKKSERLQHLQHMKDMAETLRDVKANPQQLTGNFSEYETKIRQIITNLEDDEKDCEENIKKEKFVSKLNIGIEKTKQTFSNAMNFLSKRK